MKKHKILISLAGLAAAVATTATVAAYTLAGDGSGTPPTESAGTQEPAFQDDKLPTFDLGPGQISNDGNSVSVTNPKIDGATGGPSPGGQQGTAVSADDPPAGKVVPIGKFDGDVGPTRDPNDSGVPAVHPQPVDEPQMPGAEPDIEYGHGIAVGELNPGQGTLVPINPDEFAQVLELAKLDMAERLGLSDTDAISLRKLGKMEWGNTSLGNPQPGILYAQVIVPGFKMLLEADSAFSVYHTSLEEAVFVDGRSVPASDDESGEAVEVVLVPTPKEDVEDPDVQAVRVGRSTGQLIDPLLATGAEVRVTAEVVKQPFFSVGGTIILVDGERVQVMEYRDATALEAEAAHISPKGSSTGTTMVSWVAAPHFFRTETAIVLYVGENPKVVEALTSVLGPQFAGR